MKLRKLAWLAVLIACGCTDPHKEASPTTTVPATGQSSTVGAQASTLQTDPAKDERLEIFLSIGPEVETDRVPMRVAKLHFRNVSEAPVRIYMPVSEAFRLGLSSIVFSPEGHLPLAVPAPRPHGYVVTEKDFHLLAPAQSKTFEQRFTLDPLARGGEGTARRPGFAQGAKVPLRWVYENKISRWVGGQPTMDGPTKTLFDGGDIPAIWKGRLAVTATWTVPR